MAEREVMVRLSATDVEQLLRLVAYLSTQTFSGKDPMLSLLLSMAGEWLFEGGNDSTEGLVAGALEAAEKGAYGAVQAITGLVLDRLRKGEKYEDVRKD